MADRRLMEVELHKRFNMAMSNYHSLNHLRANLIAATVVSMNEATDEDLQEIKAMVENNRIKVLQ